MSDNTSNVSGNYQVTSSNGGGITIYPQPYTSGPQPWGYTTSGTTSYPNTVVNPPPAVPQPAPAPTPAPAPAPEPAPATAQHVSLSEIFCDEAEKGVEDDGLIWKTALPVGELKLSPDFTGRPVDKALRVVEGHGAEGEIGLQDIMEAWDEQAVPHVTVPLSHTNRTEDNTGFVKKLKIEKGKDGIARLKAGLQITEPDIAAKLKRGTIANCSVGVIYDYRRKTDGKTYKAALEHLALTNRPWVPGMEPFGMAASETVDVTPLVPRDYRNAFRPSRGLVWREARVDKALARVGDFSLRDLDDSHAVVVNHEGRTFVVPYAIVQGQAILEPEDEWRMYMQPEEPKAEGEPEAKSSDESPSASDEPVPAASSKGEPTPKTDELSEAQASRVALLAENRTPTPRGGDNSMTLSEDQVMALIEENKRLKEGQRKAKIDARIEELKELGLSETPGLLSVIRELYLADDEKPAAVLLSEDGARVGVTVSEVVDRLIENLPRDKDQKLTLSQQHLAADEASRPAAESKEENLTPREKADRIRREWGFQTQLLATE